VKPPIMKAISFVISRPGDVHRDITSIVIVTTTGQQSTALTRVKTLADITPMAGAIITQVIVQVTNIQLTVNAIGNRVRLPRQRV